MTRRETVVTSAQQDPAIANLVGEFLGLDRLKRKRVPAATAVMVTRSEVELLVAIL
jgi:hypothetical protein